MTGDRPTRATIDLSALRHNHRLARELAGRRELIAVVKSDAYGHGAVQCVRELARVGQRRFAVVTVREAMALRAAGIDAELLVLGGVHDPLEARLAWQARLVPVVHHPFGLEMLRDAAPGGGAPLSVHVEVDTGMRRMGVAPDAATALLEAVSAAVQVELAGTFTHFARADEPDPAATLAQIDRFREVLAEARSAGIDPGLVHADNSAALMGDPVIAESLPEAGAVRPGLMLYGASPAAHARGAARLRPVLGLHSRVVALRDVGERDAVGYGASYHAARATRVATLPLGYGDGLLRSLGNRGEVWLAGARRPIVGRVSMDYITVEVGDAEVSIGDEATVIGMAPEALDRGPATAGVPIVDVAEAAGTLAYEVMIRIGERIPRRFIGMTASD